MKVLVEYEFTGFVEFTIDETSNDEENQNLACDLADNMRTKLKFSDLEYTGTQFLRPDESGSFTTNDGTKMGEWFDV